MKRHLSFIANVSSFTFRINKNTLVRIVHLLIWDPPIGTRQCFTISLSTGLYPGSCVWLSTENTPSRVTPFARESSLLTSLLMATYWRRPALLFHILSCSWSPPRLGWATPWFLIVQYYQVPLPKESPLSCRQNRRVFTLFHTFSSLCGSQKKHASTTWTKTDLVFYHIRSMVLSENGITQNSRFNDHFPRTKSLGFSSQANQTNRKNHAVHCRYYQKDPT